MKTKSGRFFGVIGLICLGLSIGALVPVYEPIPYVLFGAGIVTGLAALACEVFE